MRNRFFLPSFQRVLFGTFAATIDGEVPMRTIQRKAIRRFRFLSWGLLTFLLSYFLSLCVLSPQAHAALILQTAQNQQNTTRHCPAPASARDASGSRSPGQQDTRLPVCCAVVSLQKATKAASLLVDFFPVVATSPLCKTLRVAWQEPSHNPTHSHYTPHSPPLYLFHAVLLI